MNENEVRPRGDGCHAHCFVVGFHCITFDCFILVKLEAVGDRLVMGSV